jgi:hypothetical protein
VAERPGDLIWLLPPGGPGIGSESRQSLAEAIDVPVVTWLVGHVRRRIEGGAHFPWIEQPTRSGRQFRSWRRSS